MGLELEEALDSCSNWELKWQILPWGEDESNDGRLIDKW